MGIRLLLCAVALALFPAVAAGQNRQELQVNADLRMLQEQVAKIQLGLNQLGDRLKTADGRIDGVAAANLKSFADQRLVINEIVTTLSTMRERLDENTTRVSQLTQEFTAIRDGLRMLTDQLNSLVAILQPTVNPTDPTLPPARIPPSGRSRCPSRPLPISNRHAPITRRANTSWGSRDSRMSSPSSRTARRRLKRSSGWPSRTTS